MTIPATPVMRQYREAKEKHPDGILLFRLGDFYEIFFDDAKVAAPIMGVQLTSRPLGKTGRAPMCGVPHHAWQSYVGKLLRAGHKVVICDQVEPASKNKIVRRDVTRVLTPGTVVEEAYLEPSRPNYLVAAWTKGLEAGLAACEVSTGELLLCQLPKDRLQPELERLAPAELLTPPDVEEYRFDPVRGGQRLKDMLGIAFAASVGAADAPMAVGAAGVVLDYLKQNQTRIAPGSLTVRTYSPEATMPLDSATVRNLELPALVALIDRTSNPVGARQLRSWLGAPLRDAESIQLRLAAVDELVGAPGVRDRLRETLKPVGDLERLVSRAAQGHSSARELVALRHSLEAIPAVQEALAVCSALVTRELAGEVSAAPALADLLARALVDDPPTSPRDGVVRHGFDADLDAILDASKGARDWIAKLESAERRRSGIRSLKVGFNKVFGYYIAGDTAGARRGGRECFARAAHERAGDRHDGRAPEPRPGGGRAPLAPARGQRRARAEHHRRPSPAGRERPAGGRIRGERPRSRSRGSSDRDPHGAQHGGEVDLPAAGGSHRPARPVRKLRPRGERRRRAGRPHLHARWRARRHQRRHVDFHGRDDRDRVHPQPRHARLAGDLR
ncbi:MAG: hypothetical protein E6I72_10740 [Chloroflexi bacterium]|nr:MAG: hypothetical protein E6I72_10740 [Chloroflexota bacterium]